MTRIFTVLLSCSILLSSCASIVSHTSYPVSISSAPNHADFRITDVKGREILSGQTPTTVNLRTKGGYFKKQTYVIKFTKEGFDDKMMTITCDLNGWYFGNIVFGGFIGLLIVDPLTGAMYKINQRDLQAVMNQSTASVEQPEDGLQIVSINDVPENLKDKMIRVE